MPVAPIPFTTNQAGGADALGGASPIAMNVVVEPTGAVRKRPGYSDWEGQATVVDTAGVVGIHETAAGDVFAVGDAATRWIYRCVPGATTTLNNPGDGQLRGTSRPTFAETEALLVLAGGETVQKVVLATYTSSRLGGDVPQKVSHVGTAGARLICNDLDQLKSTWYYSAQQLGSASYANHEVWSAQNNSNSGAVTAEAYADGIVALGTLGDLIFAWGVRSLQAFSISSGFYPVTAMETGCVAPDSIVKLEEGFMWLDDRRRFVLGDGKSVEPISLGIQATLDALGTVSDCYGYRVQTGPVEAAVWQFPTDGVTLVYQKDAGWGQWSGPGNTAFPVTAVTRLRSSGRMLGAVGGSLMQMALGTSDNGTAIRSYVETGFLDRGSSLRKTCNGLRLTLRRGDQSVEPMMFVSWRDDLGPWGSPVTVGLGTPADQQAVVHLRGLGSYRTRQWRFEFDGTSDLVLAKAEEDFTPQEA